MQHKSHMPNFYWRFLQLRISSVSFTSYPTGHISLGHESIVRHYRGEPRQKIFHFGVHTKLPSFGAAIAPASGALQIKFPALFAHHWPTTIPLTRIDAALVQAGADHGIVDFIWICPVAAPATHYWHGYLLKILWRRASCSQSAPAGDPACFSVYRRLHVVWKTSEVHIPKISWGKNKVINELQNEFHFGNFCLGKSL